MIELQVVLASLTTPIRTISLTRGPKYSGKNTVIRINGLPAQPSADTLYRTYICIFPACFLHSKSLIQTLSDNCLWRDLIRTPFVLTLKVRHSNQLIHVIIYVLLRISSALYWGHSHAGKNLRFEKLIGNLSAGILHYVIGYAE